MAPKDPESAPLEEIDRFDGGVGWLADPEETMQRASHALVGEGGVWVVDPVDVDGVDELVSDLGDVAGVVILLDRHERDARAFADRYDVPLVVPSWMNGVADDAESVERVQTSVGGFEVHRLVDTPIWQEAILFDGETLVVPEALGTASYFRAPGERVGVHPMLRPFPPRSLRDYEPERLLVGHGRGLDAGVVEAINDAISGARSRAPAAYWKALKSAFR